MLPILTVEILHAHDFILIRQRAREIAGMLGFDVHDQTRIATAVSEIVRNACQYAGGGRVEFGLESSRPQVFTVRICDDGPGIADPEAALEGRLPSETGSGHSLAGVRQLVDDFHLESTPSRGTTVTLQKRLPRQSSVVSGKELARISQELVRRPPETPLEEMQRQNQELLTALAEARVRQEEMTRLNRELEETNRGMVALYAEIDNKNQSLRKSEARFRLMVEEVKDYAIFLLDAEGRIATWNAGAQRILGWAENEIIGQSGTVLFTPEDRRSRQPEHELNTALETGRAEDERLHLRKDNSRFWASGVMTALRDEAGNLYGYVKILRDVTERMEADEQRARHVAEIETLNARLQRAMAETHHRVKNNLQVVAALVDSQLMDSRGTLPDSALYRIGQHVRVLASIHDLLTEGAKGGTEVDVLSAQATLTKLIAMTQSTIGARRIRSAVQEAQLPIRKAASLSLMVNELISNAVKHGDGDIELTLSIDDDLARLEVCDDGPGFPPDFNPHESANTGLELIESVGLWDLQGQIAYTNRTEGGARVAVTFPLREAETTKPIQTSDTDAERAKVGQL